MKWLRSIADWFLLQYLRNKSFQDSKNSTKSGLVALIFSGDHLPEQQIAIELSSKIQKEMNLRVYPLAFINKKLDPNVTFSFPHISLEDVGAKLFPTSKNLDLFLQRDYDYLLNLDTHNYPILHYIGKQTKARHKLAINPRLPGLYDVVLREQIESGDDTYIEKTLDIFRKTYA